jgi:CRP/FNR family transcriptional regulator, anaerobic regulatory protein
MQTSQAVQVPKPMKSIASPSVRPHLRDVSWSATGCAGCARRALCLPAGLNDTELLQLHDIVTNRRRIKRGEILWETGDPLHALYAVRLGFLKSFIITGDGQVQVTGFQMSGEIVGMDAIGTGRHNSTVVALEDTEVCALPFAELDRLMDRLPTLQRGFLQIMSREIVRDQENMALLGTMRAEQRLASFLLRLSSLYQRRGYSATEFVLRMTREELGNYLGLKLETVSRLLSKLQQEGLIQVENKSVKLLDLDALKALGGRQALDS